MTNAKKKKSLLYVALSLALSVVLLVGVLVIHTAAENAEGSGDPYVEILGKNVEYSDKLHIMFALDTNYPENAGVQFWASESAVGSAELGYTADVYDYLTREEYKDTALYGKPYVRTEGIAAKDIVKDIYARAYVTVDGETYYSEVIRYSVLEYMHERLFDLSAIDDAEKTAKQKNQVILYNRTLEYAASAQAVLGTDEGDRFASDEFVFVEVVGGTLSDGYTSGLFTPGESVTVNVDETKNFSGWKVGDTIVSTDETYTFVPNGSVRLTATYTKPVATVNVVSGIGGGTYEVGALVTLTAENKSASNQTFKRWVLDGVTVSTSSTYNFAVTDDMVGKTYSYTAEYYEPVTISVTNGSGSGTYAVGATVTIDAEDKKSTEKKVFKAWSGSSASTSDTIDVIITEEMAGGSYSYTATYYDPVTVTVTNGTGEGTYAVGETFTVAANDNGYPVVGIFKGDTLVTSDNSLTVQVTAAMAGTTLQYAVMYRTETKVYIDGDYVGTYAYGEEYTVTAPEVDGKLFKQWGDGTKSLSITATADGTDKYYTTEYQTLGTATFDDAAEGDFVSWSDTNNVTYGGVKLTGSTSNADGGYKIAYDPEDGTNKVLYVYEEPNSNEKNNGNFNIYVDSATTGAVTVIEFDIYIESSSNSAVLQFFFGKSYGGVYAQRLDYTDGAYRYYEYYQSDSDATNIDVMFRRNKWINVRYEYYPIYEGSSVVDFKMVQYVDDKPVMISSTPYNVTNQSTFNVLHIWQLSGAYGDFYFDNIRAYRTDSPEMTIPTELDKSEVSGDVVRNEAYLYQWEHAYDQVNELYGAEVATAIQGMTDRLFGTDTYTWLAGLYDPKTGGIYFSNSARDNFGYLPDIESTAQGFGLMGSLGVADVGNILTPEQKARIGAWMQMMQSNRDGYFYHPQWGTNITASRRSRDLTQNGQGLVNSYAGEWLFDHPEYRLGNTGAKQGVASELTYSLSASSAYLVSRVVLAADTSVDESLPKHLLTLDAYKKYLNDLWFVPTANGTPTKDIYSNNCYSFGNTITSQGAQIIARDKKAGFDGEYDQSEDGFVEATINFLNARQEEAQAERVRLGLDPNGLWEVDAVTNSDGSVTDYESTYYTISGLLKIIGIYNKMKASLPYAEQAAYSAIKMIMGDAAAYKAAGEAIVSVYNPVNATTGVLSNIKNYGDEATRSETVAEIRKYMADNALTIVQATEAKIALYRCEDGSYGYGLNGSSSTSQGAPSAVPNTKEGDVNGTALAVGARSAMLSCLGLSSIPLLPKYDGCTTYDFGDGNGAVPTTHLDIFKHLIAEQDPAIKNTIGKVDGSYDFEDGNLPEGDYTLVENAGDNYIVVDTATDLGFNMALDPGSTEFYYEFSTDMSFNSVSAGTPVEIVVGNESIIVLQLNVSGGKLSFATRSTATNDAGTGSFTIDPNTEFNLNVKAYALEQTEGNTSYYAKLTVTQNGTEYVQYFNSFYSVIGFINVVSGATVSNLTGASMTLDNVNFVKHGNTKGEYGDYHFDEYNFNPVGVTGGEIVVGIDNMLDTNGETVTLRAGNYYKAPFNFIETQFTMINNTYKVGDSGRVEMLDRDGKVIMALGYVLGNNTYTVDLLGAFSAGKPTKGQTLLTVPADISKEITVRAEFHYDRTISGESTPTLDVIVKYIDAETGLMDAKAATVSGVLVSETGSAAAEFATLAFTSTSESVYLNDVYTKRVLTIEQSADSSGDDVTGETLGKYDFTNGDPLGGVTGGGSGISYVAGTMVIGPKAGNLKIVQSNYNADTVYTTGDQFVMKMDFTFVSGKAGSDDYKPAWAGFLTDGDYLHNSTIHQSQMTYNVSGDGNEATALKWLGFTFQKGVTYSIEVVYTVGSGSKLYVDGALVSSAPVKTATADAGNFYGFGVEMRTSARGNNDFVFVLDNVDLYVVEAN